VQTLTLTNYTDGTGQAFGNYVLNFGPGGPVIDADTTDAIPQTEFKSNEPFGAQLNRLRNALNNTPAIQAATNNQGVSVTGVQTTTTIVYTIPFNGPFVNQPQITATTTNIGGPLNFSAVGTTATQGGSGDERQGNFPAGADNPTTLAFT